MVPKANHRGGPDASPGGRQRERIDRLLVQRGLCDTRSRAQAIVLAGKVVVQGRRVDKPGTLVPLAAEIQVKGTDHPYVSRGGVKLKGAIDVFTRQGLVLEDRTAMDVGASTGGFTDCLLQEGIAKVHAIDVGYGQLAWKLVADPRVVVHDRCNIRTLDPAQIGEPIDLVVIDCSFIGLGKILPHLPTFLAASADVLALVKPQFELGRESVGKGGIVRDPAARERAVSQAAEQARQLGFAERGRIESPITGQKGNVELFLWLSWAAGARDPE